MQVNFKSVANSDFFFFSEGVLNQLSRQNFNNEVKPVVQTVAVHTSIRDTMPLVTEIVSPPSGYPTTVTESCNHFQDQ